MPGNQSGVMMGQSHFEGSQPNAADMTAQPAMYFMPSYFDPQINAYMYYPQMNSIPTPLTSVCNPSQHLKTSSSQASMSGPTPHVSQPSPMRMMPSHSVGLEHLTGTILPNGPPTASNNQTSQPKVRISFKNNPSKIITINDLAKPGLFERSPSAVSNSDVQSEAGCELMHGNNLEYLNDAPDELIIASEAKQLAKQRLQEYRSGSKALLIKKPISARIATPSPLSSPHPSPKLIKPPSSMTEEPIEPEVIDQHLAHVINTPNPGILVSHPGSDSHVNTQSSPTFLEVTVESQTPDPNIGVVEHKPSLVTDHATGDNEEISTIELVQSMSGQCCTNSDSSQKDQSGSPSSSSCRQQLTTSDQEQEIAYEGITALIKNDQIQSPDLNGIYRYSTACLYKICIPSLPVPPNTNLAVFDGTNVKSDHNEPFRSGRKGGYRAARGDHRRDVARRGGSDRDSGDFRRGSGRRGSRHTHSVNGDGFGSAPSSPAMNKAEGISFLPEDLLPLEKGLEAWVPESIQTKLNHGRPMASNDNDEDEEAYCARISKQTRGLLNKLTPENLTRLQVRFAEQLLYPSALTTLCEAIVRKSFDEPKYASLYASLTLYMYRNIVPLMGAPDNEEGIKSVRGVTRRLIIQSCQKQFLERPKWAHLSKGSITEEQFEEVVRIKSKVIGNMRFVGELYNYQVLSNSAIEKILMGLLSDLDNPAEEDLECLIMLMNTCFPYLRQQKGKDFMDQLFIQIQHIVDKAEPIPRIKFALGDLLSMQKSSQSQSKQHIHLVWPSSSVVSSPRTAENGSRERIGWMQRPYVADRRSNGSDRPQRYEEMYSGNDCRSGRSHIPYRAASNIRPTSMTLMTGVPVTKNPFAALAQDDSASEQSEEDTYLSPNVQSILTRPSSSNITASTSGTEEMITLDKAIENMKTDMNAFMLKLDPSALVDQLKKYPKDKRSAVIGCGVDIVMDKKKDEVAAFGKALALAVERMLISPKLVMDGIMASCIFQDYDEMKCDIPFLDSFTLVMCEEMSTSIGNEYLQSILKLAKAG